MKYIIYSGLISLFVNVLIGFFVFIKNPNRALNRSFFGLSTCIGFWSTGSFALNFFIKNCWLALLLLKGSYIFAIFLLYVFLRFVYVVIDVQMSLKWKWFLMTFVVFFLVMLPGHLFIN